MSQPWIAKRVKYSELKSLLEKLVECTYKHMSYLYKKNDKMQEAHKQSNFHVVSDNLELRTIQPACEESVAETYR